MVIKHRIVIKTSRRFRKPKIEVHSGFWNSEQEVRGILAKYRPKAELIGLERIYPDHIVPIALGGPEFDLNNVQLLCSECNKSKTARDAAEIAKRRKLIKRVGENPTPLSHFFETK